MTPGRRSLLLAVGAGLLLAASAEAQRYFREGSFAPQYAPARMPDSEFTVCRLQYRRTRYEEMGMGWMTDYPYAERNLMIRLSELTKTPISTNRHRDPNSWVVRATDP